MTETRERALALDAKVQRAENIKSALLKVLAAIVVVGVLAASAFSAVAARETRSTARAAKIATAVNHQTGIQNNQILKQINAATSHHTQTINTIGALQADLDRKFDAVIHVICVGSAAHDPACVKLLALTKESK